MSCSVGVGVRVHASLASSLCPFLAPHHNHPPHHTWLAVASSTDDPIQLTRTSLSFLFSYYSSLAASLHFFFFLAAVAAAHCSAEATRRGQDARQDGLRGDEPGALVAAALPDVARRRRRRRRHQGRRVLRAEPVQGLPRRRDQDGHVRALHAGAQPHGVPPPLPLLRRQGLLLQPLLAQGQGRGTQGRACGQGVAGDRRHRGRRSPRRRRRAQGHAQALQVLPHLRRRVRHPLLLLRARALGCQPLSEAADRHEEHYVSELHHPGGHGRVAGADGHGDHQLDGEVHLPQHRHLLRHPRHGRPLHALIQPAQRRLRRSEEVLPGAEQPEDGERGGDGEQGAAVRQRADADGAAGGREGGRGQGGAGADDTADDGAVAGVRAGGAGEAALHQGDRVQGAHEPGQAQQAHLPRQGLPIPLIN